MDDPYEFGKKSTHWNVSFEQVSTGRFIGEVTELWLKSIQIMREVSNQALLESGESWKTSHTFGIFLSRGGSGRCFGTSLRTDHICAVSSGHEIDIRTPEGFERTSVTFRADTLDRYLSDFEKDLLTSRLAMGQLKSGPASTGLLRSFLLSVLDSVSASPRLMAMPQPQKTLEESVASAVLDYVISPIAESSDDGLTPAKEGLVVKYARHYIMEHIEEPITVLELCRHLHVSRRTLQYCFEKLLGVSPSVYLRLRRLNGAHRDLRTADAAAQDVTTVAMRWGFWHLPRFSMYYRQLFGEYPSETLKNSRSRSDGLLTS